MSRTKAIQAKIFSLSNELQDLQDQRDVLALALVDSPESAEALKAIESIDQQRSETKRQLNIFSDAMTQAEREELAAIRAARIAGLVGARNRAAEAAKARIKVGQQIDVALQALFDVLAQWQTLSKEIYVNSFDIAREAAGGRDHQFSSNTEMLHNMIDIPVQPPLIEAMRTGPMGSLLFPHVEFPRLGSHDRPVDTSVEVAAIRSAERIIHRIDDMHQQVKP
ncbi:MAG: hypothetical protein Q7J47_06005 [Azoarcus sp.]|nr:hypothetical protein [Azoarcus sp.]